MILCIVLKILGKVILNRIQEKIDVNLQQQQAGFRAGISCVNYFVTLRTILEQVNEFQGSLAFDRLNHENLWSALKRKGIPDKITYLIEAQYEAFTCRVLHNGALSDPTRIVAGVRQ